MNKTYRSIWNASLGCYVAAPECAAAHTAGTSCSRAARSTPLMRSKSALVLEPRVLFDGAMLVTAMEQGEAPEAPVMEDIESDSDEAPAATVDAPAAVETPSQAEAEEAAPSDSDAAAPDGADNGDDTTPLATAPESSGGQEIVFVDGRVTDPAAFQGENREVIVLTLDQDGLSQIASALDGRSGIAAIHIVSHGSDGVLSLGSTEVTAESIQSTQLSYLQNIGQALSAEGDILIYACDYAAGEAGLETMQLIADITGADVAASTDATGHESLGGDWALEQSTGAIETLALAPEGWIGGLDFSFTDAGTVGALGMANNIMGAGVTVVSATYQGGATQSGTFTAGSGITFGSNVLGFTSGTILSTGSHAASVAGPNSDGGYGNDAPDGVDGDAVLDAMAGNPTFDAAILDINFTPDVPPGAMVGDTGRMTLEIVFGSDEFLEYVGSINDVMEVTVNGQVVSLVPNSSGGESTIGINSVNSTQNTSLFINNEGGTYNTQMDGFTVTIPMVFDVVFGQVNSMRLAVADSMDNVYDSWLFIRADSAQTVVVAEDDTVTTATNLPITVDLTANDYSLAGGSMSLTHIQGNPVSQGDVITLGSGIEISVGAGGQITVTGDGSSAANDTFTYQVSNGMGGVASATVNVEVTALNLNPPAAQDDVEAVMADASLSDSVLTDNGNGADSDPNGDPLSVVQVNLTEYTPGAPMSLPSGALLTMNANGTYVYDPNGAFDGLADGATTTDSFSYTVTDGQGGNDTASVTITVTGVASNHAPVAVDDSFTVSEEGGAYLANPLANDSDADGDELSLVLSSDTGSTGGTISTDDSGNLIFIAGAAFDNLAVGETRDTTFEYTVSDASGATDTATITVTVEGANDAPVAADDAYDVSEEGGHFLQSPLLNDSDPDSVDLFVSLNSYTGNSGGSFSMDDGGNLIFIAGSDFDDLNVGQTRQTSVTYTVSDDLGAQSAATITVTVHGANDGPVGGNDEFSVFEDQTVSLGSVTVNDSDVDGGDLYVGSTGVFAGDAGGLFSFDDGGGLIFQPNGEFDDLREGETRTTRFDYALLDSQGGSALASVTINVMGVNDAPVAQDDSFIGFEDTSIILGSMLANDTDVDSSDLYTEVAAIAGSHGGQFEIDDALVLTFNPAGDFEDLRAGESRETSFTYLVHDGHGGSAQAVVTVVVAGANDDPVAQDDQFDADNIAPVSLGSLTDNDSDVEGDELSVVQFADTAGTQGGIFSVADGGSLNFDPAGAFDDLAVGETRETSCTYTLSDGLGGVSYATVTVTVHGAEPADPEGTGDEVVTEPTPTYPNDVVFVDARIPDPQAFAIGGRELIVLTLDEDGLTQIAAALNGRSGVEAVHIVSHGGDGYLTLGSGDIDAASIVANHLPALQALAQALTADGDILIYACDFASGVEGQNTMQLFAQYTVADVAASLGTTGHESLNGNWALESTVGTVEATVLAPVGWVHTLNLSVAPPAGNEPAPASGADTPVAAITAGSAALTERSMVEVAGRGSELALPVRSLEASGAVRMVSLETVFRQTLSPYMLSLADTAPRSQDFAGTDLMVVAPLTIDIDTGHDEPAGWLPTVEVLDDSLVHELVANAEVPGDQEVDALVLPRQQAAPGFAAQLARWSQWSNQRPLTRAVARA